MYTKMLQAFYYVNFDNDGLQLKKNENTSQNVRIFDSNGISRNHQD